MAGIVGPIDVPEAPKYTCFPEVSSKSGGPVVTFDGGNEGATIPLNDGSADEVKTERLNGKAGNAIVGPGTEY